MYECVRACVRMCVSSSNIDVCEREKQTDGRRGVDGADTTVPG